MVVDVHPDLRWLGREGAAAATTRAPVGDWEWTGQLEGKRSSPDRSGTDEVGRRRRQLRRPGGGTTPVDGSGDGGSYSSVQGTRR
jgi:hypothetical protein